MGAPLHASGACLQLYMQIVLAYLHTCFFIFISGLLVCRGAVFMPSILGYMQIVIVFMQMVFVYVYSTLVILKCVLFVCLGAMFVPAMLDYLQIMLVYAEMVLNYL